MKNIFKSFAALILGSAFLLSCEKDDKQVIFQGGTDPVLSSSVAPNSNIPLSFANQDNPALTLSWTNPDYMFSTGVSSQDITYSIEIDTVGANFTNPNKQTVTVANDLSRTFTQGQLNDYFLNQMVLKPSMPHEIEIRVSSSLNGGAGLLYSNTIRYTVVPFPIPPKVNPPGTPVGNPPTDWTGGHLYIVGSATPGGWNNPVPEPAQEFTKISSTMYEITIALNANEFYLFLPVNGSWNTKYGAMGANGSNNINGDDFKEGGGDMQAPSASGNYKIVVDFQRGKFTVTRL